MRVFAALALILLAGAAHADPHGFAVLQALDKVTARISDVVAPLDQPTRFGSLEITARSCRETPPTEPPESAAFLEIRELPPAADAAAALFSDTALSITRLPVEDHDRYMQYVLGLSHLVALLFAATLARGYRSYDELARLASTTFLKEARTAAEVARENPRLYHEIQHLNRHSAELFAEVRAALADLEAAALDADPGRFIACMERGRAFFPQTLPLELG